MALGKVAVLVWLLGVCGAMRAQGSGAPTPGGNPSLQDGSTSAVSGEDSKAYNAANFDSLQAAIDAAIAAGVKTVVVPEGRYTGRLLIHGALTLDCVSRQSILTIADGANTDVIDVAQGISDVTIRNCTIAGNGSKQTGKSNGIDLADKNANIVIENVAVTDTLADGIHVHYAYPPKYVNENITVKESLLSNCGSACLVIRDTQGLWVTQNSFINWGVNKMESDAIAVAGLNTNVHINGNTGVALSSDFFFMESAAPGWMQVITGGDITDNTITSSPNGRSAATGFSGYFFDTTFTRNTLIAPVATRSCGPYSGFEMEGSNLTVAGNRVVNGAIMITAYGKGKAVNNTVDGNTIIDSCTFNGWAAVSVGRSLIGAPTNTRILHNLIDLTGIPKVRGGTYASGITIGDSDGASGSVLGFSVEGNTILMNGNATAPAIAFSGTDPKGTPTPICGSSPSQCAVAGGEIDNNRILSPNAAAIGLVWYADGAAVSGLFIHNNDLRGSKSGIALGTATDVQQRGNRLH